MVTFDEGSGYVKVGGLKEKTPEAVKDMFIKLWGGELRSFMRFRTDNGGEFGGVFDAYLAERGTHHECSIADRPQTNSRVEGLNRRIIEGTAAALLQANAPYYFGSTRRACGAKRARSPGRTGRASRPTRRCLLLGSTPLTPLGQVLVL